MDSRLGPSWFANQRAWAPGPSSLAGAWPRVRSARPSAGAVLWAVGSGPDSWRTCLVFWGKQRWLEGPVPLQSARPHVSKHLN